MKGLPTIFLSTFLSSCICILLILASCQKLNVLPKEDPDLKVLEYGFKSSMAIGYCASIANMVFKGEPVPNNVTFDIGHPSEYSNSGLIYIHVTDADPLPFNDNIGDVVIAALWDGSQHSGVMSILFADIDLLNADFKFYGIHTVPFIEEEGTGKIITVFAEQDVVIGEGEDTLINLSLSKPKFDLETTRATSPPPSDVFAAVRQNVWFIKVNQNGTFPDILDDTYEINGGGQIAEATNESGGIQYHALIETRVNYQNCYLNPTSGTGFIQNIKAGTSIDLGNILLDFHESCDSQAQVKVAAGEYFRYLGRDVNLNFE